MILKKTIIFQLLDTVQQSNFARPKICTSPIIVWVLFFLPTQEQNAAFHYFFFPHNAAFCLHKRKKSIAGQTVLQVCLACMVPCFTCCTHAIRHTGLTPGMRSIGCWCFDEVGKDWREGEKNFGTARGFGNFGFFFLFFCVFFKCGFILF